MHRRSSERPWSVRLELRGPKVAAPMALALQALMAVQAVHAVQAVEAEKALLKKYCCLATKGCVEEDCPLSSGLLRGGGGNRCERSRINFGFFCLII